MTKGGGGGERSITSTVDTGSGTDDASAAQVQSYLVLQDPSRGDLKLG